ncbi:hypothetical protein AB6E04_05405 [Vibrio amylolyticus]|uniref:hypothetical protein n=1 Tax=Vibrio amylolyticus TaxID=2847292 RepID=UPI00354D3286
MKLFNLVFLCFLVSVSSYAQDDSDYNSTARKIKNQLSKQLRKIDFEDNQFCDLILEMKQSGNYVSIRRVSGTGSSYICRESKKLLNKKKKYRYTDSQKYLHIHVASKSL